jgi:uncharacterized protein YkwD
MIFSSNQPRVSLRIKLIVIIIVFVVIIVSIIAATLSLSGIISTTKYNNSNQGTTSSLIQKQTRTISYNELIQYALKKINEDRSKSNIPSVKLSNDNNNNNNNKTAAQLQAEDMLRTRQISHYTSNGMKPYMEYTLFGGKGYVAQNVGYDGFNNSQTNIINKCKIGVYICTPIDPIKSIDELEYSMMYYDSIFNWSHRNNILDKHHTHVSIGIAYDKYSLAFVQNFENNYIRFDKPIIKVNNLAYNRYDTNNDYGNNSSKGNIEVSGKVLGNCNSVDSIHVYYDEKPTFLIYNQHKNDNLYDMGKLVADIVKQLPPHYHAVNQHYKEQSSTNYTLIQASKWWISSTALTLQRGESSLLYQQSIDIQFNISSLLNSEGIYTIVVYLRHNNNHDTFPVTSYSIFFFR